ncbi:restriction system protein [Sulfobacillus thermosulfidooxidans DSM 9293]|uniref:Restriction system protein n=1 Tax=Sulfobacillus thermosulfidooxidans (strain DSM 9293 / VKM B-1269 / AT-1) TaxID=929705 RepID=A0A1W1W7L2_SULTA|nr:restriction endonuclease [Sulfobacillus thermosulfidooxidans]SMC02182.1 restriction system protein [Sulfobacillus thermosulfidooxidans DSM 9293]
MAQLTQRRIGEIMRAVFDVLAENPDGLPAREVLAQVEQRLPLTDFEKSTYPKRPHIRRFEKVVRFATIAPVKAGWLIKDKGQWILTDAGRSAYHRFTDPVALKREANRLYKQWHATLTGDDSNGESTETDQDMPDPSSIVEEAEETAWAQIKDYLRHLNPFDFQNLVAALLRSMGYFVEWIAPPGPDGGIDIVAHTDPLGAKGPRILVQVKHRDNKATVEELRSFLAILGDSDVGLFVSTEGFTAEAEKVGRSQERRRIMLLNLERLFDLWVQHYPEIPDTDRKLLPLRPIYYLVP